MQCHNLTKICNLFYKFYILREFMCKKLLMLVYGSFVESLLRYGIIVWRGAYESNLKPLKVIQNTILKIVFHKDRRYPTRQLYDEGVCNIAGLYVCVICFFIHRNDNLKQFVKHQYDTRAKVGRSLVIPKNNKAII